MQEPAKTGVTASVTPARHLRFGLGGLVLFVLFLASLAAVWQRREAWVLSERSGHTQRIEREDFFFGNKDGTGIAYAPDGVRGLANESGTYIGYIGRLGIYEISKLEKNSFLTMGDYRLGAQSYIRRLNDITVTDIIISWKFLDDDRIEIVHVSNTDSARYFKSIWRRRHPEWWWGHFYRPEVWLVLAFGALWLWRVVRALKTRRAVPAPVSACGLHSESGRCA